MDESITLITGFIQCLDEGNDVSKRKLRRVLTDEELRDIDDSWKSRSNLIKEFSTRPSELDQYVDLLTKADRLTNLCSRFAHKYRNDIDKRSAVKKMVNKVDGAYERALECLQETLDQYPGMASHLDRSVSFEPGYEPGIFAEGMPRWIGSRSHLAQGGLMNVGTKRDVKREALERKLSQLQGDDDPEVDLDAKAKALARLERLKRKGLM